MRLTLGHLKIRRDSILTSWADGICSSDCPIVRWIEAIRDQTSGHFVRCHTKFLPVSTSAKRCQSHWHRTVERLAQTCACPAQSINRANLEPRTARDVCDLMWRLCAGNLDAVKFPFASLGVENQMCQSISHTDSRRPRRVLKHTFDRVPFHHWSTTSCAPNRQHDFRSLFSCPSKCRISAESVDCRTDPNSMCISIYPEKITWISFEENGINHWFVWLSKSVHLSHLEILSHLAKWIEHPISNMEAWIAISRRWICGWLRCWIAARLIRFILFDCFVQFVDDCLRCAWQCFGWPWCHIICWRRCIRFVWR